MFDGYSDLGKAEKYRRYRCHRISSGADRQNEAKRAMRCRPISWLTHKRVGLRPVINPNYPVKQVPQFKIEFRGESWSQFGGDVRKIQRIWRVANCLTALWLASWPVLGKQKAGVKSDFLGPEYWASASRHPGSKSKGRRAYCSAALAWRDWLAELCSNSTKTDEA